MERYHRSCTCTTVDSVTECVTEWISVKVAIVNVLCHVYMFINSVKVDKWLLCPSMFVVSPHHIILQMKRLPLLIRQSINGIVGGPLTLNPLGILRTA